MCACFPPGFWQSYGNEPKQPFAIFEEKLDGTMDYLAEEGYFDNKKKVKVIGMTIKDNE